MPEADPLNADYASLHPDSFARVVAGASVEEVSGVLERLPGARAAAVAARLPSATVAALVERDAARASAWLADAPFDDAVLLLSRLKRDSRLELIDGVSDRNRRQQLSRQQRYPDHSVGSLVRGVGVTLTPDATVDMARQALAGLNDDAPLPIAVVDSAARYVGMVDPYRLVAAKRGDGGLGSLIDRVTPIPPEARLMDAARMPGLREHRWLPVVDHRGRLLGCVARSALLGATLETVGPRGQPGLLQQLADDIIRMLSALLDTVLAAGQRR